MKQLIIFFSLVVLILLTSCWPSRIGFKDTGSMDPRWKNFTVKNLELSAPNAPLNYAARLTEDVKIGIQNNTRLKLVPQEDECQLIIEGAISNYNVSPMAMQVGDVAAKNRLTVSAEFTIFINVPHVEGEPLQEDKMTVRSTRFVDYNSNQDLSVVENQLIEEINKQIVQDVINKLFSNW